MILAGVRSVGLLDDAPATIDDLGAQFYLSPEDVKAGKSRASASLNKLATLNQYVDVKLVTGPVDEALVKNYSAIVLTDATVSEQLRVNELTRKLEKKFLSGNIYGFLTSVFVDNGDDHVVSDLDGEAPLRGLISHVTNGAPGVVTTHDETRHGLSTGNYVTFEDVEGMTELNDLPPQKIKVLSPYSFSICDTTGFSTFCGTKGYFNQVKMPEQIPFKSLTDALKEEVPPFSNDIMGDSQQLHDLWLAISAFRDEHGGACPRSWVRADAAAVVEKVREIQRARNKDSKNEGGPEEKDGNTTLLNLARASGAQMSPVASFLGGILGQEVLKACSHKFTPITQFFHYAFPEALPALPEKEDDWVIFKPKNSRYDSYIAALGADVHAAIMDQQLFLVGAGAIGCEMLKNWALMGVAAGDGVDKKSVIVTDMDMIEKSNLNRQFLFRPKDVGQLKSKAAGAAAQAMNPHMRVIAHSLKVAADTESTYNDAFWAALDGVYTALDNVDTRLYVDEKCIAYCKSMVDSGTLGTKGNTQAVVASQTESYGSTRDPPEEGIPICTLKNFPHKIEHTIQWARDMFEGEFNQAPEEVNKYLTKYDYAASFGQQVGELVTALKTVQSRLAINRPLTFDDCILWARAKFTAEFRDPVAQLLVNFPPDAMTSEGTPFWSGTKRAPTPLEFDEKDPAHMAFVVAAANLYAFNYGLNGHEDVDKFRAVIAEGYKEKPFVPRQVKIATTEAEAKQIAEGSMADLDLDAQVRDLLASLPQPSTLSGYRLHPVEFEKDDDTNYHIAFITACSNLRARNYKIKEESAHKTKFVAGKIIPAIATTTALVTGLVCIEMMKLRQNKPVEAYRNTFVNLAINVVAASEPSPPVFQVTKTPKMEYRWSLWDKVRVDKGGRDITLQELFNEIEDRFGLRVTMLNYGAAMLFMDLGMGLKPHFKARLSMPLSKVVEEVIKKPVDSNKAFLQFEMSCVDEEDNEYDLPPVVVKFR